MQDARHGLKSVWDARIARTGTGFRPSKPPESRPAPPRAVKPARVQAAATSGRCEDSAVGRRNGRSTQAQVGQARRIAPTILASYTDFNPWRATCKTDLEQANPVHPVAPCLLEGPGPAVAFYGDSHADALQGGLFPLAERAGFRFYSVTRSSCPPVTGLTRTPGGDDACDDFVRGVEDYLASADFPVVVLAARWSAGLADAAFDNGEGGVDPRPNDVLTPLGASPTGDPDRIRLVVARYVETIERLLAAGHRIVLIYPIPEAGWNVPEELARRREAAGHPVTLSTPRAAYDARHAAVIAAFDAIDDPRVFRVRPADLLCDTLVPGRCVNSIGDQPLYFDDDHLNNTGALLVGERILAAIEEARRDAAGG